MRTAGAHKLLDCHHEIPVLQTSRLELIITEVLQKLDGKLKLDITSNVSSRSLDLYFTLSNVVVNPMGIISHGLLRAVRSTGRSNDRKKAQPYHAVVVIIVPAPCEVQAGTESTAWCGGPRRCLPRVFGAQRSGTGDERKANHNHRLYMPDVTLPRHHTKPAIILNQVKPALSPFYRLCDIPMFAEVALSIAALPSVDNPLRAELSAF